MDQVFSNYTMPLPCLCEFSTCLCVSDPLLAPCCLLPSLTLVISPCICASTPLRPSSFSSQAPPWLVLFMWRALSLMAFSQNHLFFINRHDSCHVPSLLFVFITSVLFPESTLPLSCAASHMFICPQQNNDNETPLHCAAQYGHSQVVRLLLEELTDPTMRNNKFETPLDLAALYGRLEVVKLLLSAHPNLLSCNTKKHTPLHLASRNGHLSVVEVLLDAGMDINYEVRLSLQYICVYTRVYVPKSFSLQVFLNVLSWPKSCWVT